jgi:predicted Rossmann fold nucleotide-binding protein DprA/Smf involved in DNA uptake
VESAEDVLRELGWAKSIPYREPAGPEVVGPAQKIFNALTDVPIDRDELLSRVAVDAKCAATLLVQLEMQGLIRALPGGKLVRS